MKTILLILAVAALPLAALGGAPVEQIYRNEIFRFRMVYPAGWKEKESKSPGVLTSREKEGASVNVTANFISPGGNEAAIFHSLTKESAELALSQEDPPSALVSFAKQLVDSVPAVVIVSTRNRSPDSDVRVQSVQYLVAKDDCMYVITGTTLENRFPDWLPELQRIVASIKFEK